MKTAIALLGLALAGCGGSDNASDGGGGGGAGGGGSLVSCDSVQGTTHVCVEVSGDHAAKKALMDGCPSTSTVGTGCSKTGQVGGCKRTEATYSTWYWSYAPATAADVMGSCGDKKVYVAP